jgi:hypothetical protein
MVMPPVMPLRRTHLSKPLECPDSNTRYGPGHWERVLYASLLRAGRFVRPAFLSVAAAIIALVLGFAIFHTGDSRADVPRGSEDGARSYYKSLATTLGFSTPDGIFQTTLDDVASYLGYGGIQGIDLQNLPPEVLMDPNRLLAPCPPDEAANNCPNTLRNLDALRRTLGAASIQPDDILAIRFFAPKIMNIKLPEDTRPLGWRKLVRLRARPGSAAQMHNIASGIILFNIFTDRNATPFSPRDESVNTQVMLVTELSRVPRPNQDGPDTLYWLDYDKLSKGGRLAFALEASFDANELDANEGVQPYFVPDGCVACHGNNETRSMVNYLDTDHWYDRLDNDFPEVKRRGLALVFDARTNDTTAPAYASAFDVIRRFNEEADAQAHVAQPRHDEVLASQKWLELHASSHEHFPPIKRAIGPAPQWSPAEADVLSTLNQYCFRCHGTVKFSVFNRQSVQDRRPNIKERIKADAVIGDRMPPDRDLPDGDRTFLNDHLP